MQERNHDPALDWPSVIREGDVVRSSDGRWIGVVLVIANYSGDDKARWELHVDAAKHGIPQGVGIWPPWDAVVANDDASIEEARALGLRWPHPHRPKDGRYAEDGT